MANEVAIGVMAYGVADGVIANGVVTWYWIK